MIAAFLLLLDSFSKTFGPFWQKEGTVCLRKRRRKVIPKSSEEKRKKKGVFEHKMKDRAHPEDLSKEIDHFSHF